MRPVCRWEVEEFIEEVSLRPTMWMGKDRLWVRRRDGDNELAIKFLNGLPDDMFSVNVVRLRDSLSQSEAEVYVEWLLKKFTGFAYRLEIEKILRSELVPENAVERIACLISHPKNYDDVVVVPAPPPKEEKVVPLPLPEEKLVKPLEVPKTSKRLSYIQKLIQKG